MLPILTVKYFAFIKNGLGKTKIFFKRPSKCSPFPEVIPIR